MPLSESVQRGGSGRFRNTKEQRKSLQLQAISDSLYLPYERLFSGQKLRPGAKKLKKIEQDFWEDGEDFHDIRGQI